jgi:hypothetical protein
MTGIKTGIKINDVVDFAARLPSLRCVRSYQVIAVSEERGEALIWQLGPVREGEGEPSARLTAAPRSPAWTTGKSDCA